MFRIALLAPLLLLSGCSAGLAANQYHRSYHLNQDRTLREDPPSRPPTPVEISKRVADLQTKHSELNRRLMALNYAENYKNKAPTLAGVYPLTVTRFTCTCARNDEDKMCEQITARMGNLRIIKNVPFMRKGNAVIGMRSQGLVDESTGKTDTVDPQEEAQVTECYTAAAAFNTAPSDSQNLPALAETARKACISVPAKRLYQEYDAFMKGIRYNAD